MKRDTLTYAFLLEFYLRNMTTGKMGEFNDKYFPNDFKEMEKELKGLLDEKE